MKNDELKNKRINKASVITTDGPRCSIDVG